MPKVVPNKKSVVRSVDLLAVLICLVGGAVILSDTKSERDNANTKAYDTEQQLRQQLRELQLDQQVLEMRINDVTK